MPDSQKKQALISAMRLLAASAKSRQVISEKLEGRGFPPEIVKEALDQLESQGLLSDKAFGQSLVSRFTHSKPAGKRMIAFELKRKGIPVKIREELLDNVTPENELEKAREIGALRWDKFKNLDKNKRKKRLYDFLGRRGFDFDVIRQVAEELERDSNES